MGMSNFPNGFKEGVSIRGVPLVQSHPGKVFYVNNSGVNPDNCKSASDTNPGHYLAPKSTINGAVAACTAGRGDIICVMPGHVETVTAAAGVALSKSGVALVGLGTGSLRAKINITNTAGTVALSAASTSMHNILITGGVDAIVSPVVVSASDCTIERCELRDVTGQMTLGILTTASADRLAILDHTHDGATAAGTNSAIKIVGGADIEITAKKIDGNFAVGIIDVATTATTDLAVHSVKSARNRNSADIFIIDTITGSTGQIGPDINIRIEDNAANITEAVTGATFVVQDPVYVVNLAGEKGMLINWTASTDA